MTAFGQGRDLDPLLDPGDRFLQVQAIPIYNRKQKVDGIMEFYRDVTLEKTYEQQLQQAEVLDDEGVGADFAEIIKIFAHSRNFFLGEEVVHRHVQADVAGAGIFDRPGQGVVVEVGVVAVHAHVEAFAAQINRVGAGGHRRFQGAPGAGRGEEFDGFARRRHEISSLCKEDGGRYT